ncbi:uncharacterized protein BDZ99DRAFT_154629 [Mytilinidion resinicola]|uniref:Uncharacterized protein n=1 Tax=Mytilinidion resinicola TaxID=574789 RepID=A0A6A6Y6Z1_9PEZI|nr:uncharacterized protein BDZ99DRAFT_154629 [Mytilinidion resinicola]KAF2804298.1 hypothetical protein BDZ99DRAFT_154629 [Mytilinidion resinicola]
MRSIHLGWQKYQTIPLSVPAFSRFIRANAIIFQTRTHSRRFDYNDQMVHLAGESICMLCIADISHRSALRPGSWQIMNGISICVHHSTAVYACTNINQETGSENKVRVTGAVQLPADVAVIQTWCFTLCHDLKSTQPTTMQAMARAQRGWMGKAVIIAFCRSDARSKYGSLKLSYFTLIIGSVEHARTSSAYTNTNPASKGDGKAIANVQDTDFSHLYCEQRSTHASVCGIYGDPRHPPINIKREASSEDRHQVEWVECLCHRTL